jgi:Bacterial TSP3 repeat
MKSPQLLPLSFLRVFLLGTVSMTHHEAGAQPMQPQVSLTSTGPGTWQATWAGVTQRTYFMQWSLDLANWNFVPIVEYGTGAKVSGMAAQNAPKYFIRLHYVDAPWIATLQQARDSDFDNDGIPSFYEVETIGTNPLDQTSAGGDIDGDGLADGWEKFYFGNTITANPATIQSSDGLTNKEKSELGLNPNLNYSDTAAVQPAKFNYDLVGRLTGVTAPVGAGAFTPDEEGNLTNAQ